MRHPLCALALVLAVTSACSSEDAAPGEPEADASVTDTDESDGAALEVAVDAEAPDTGTSADATIADAQATDARADGLASDTRTDTGSTNPPTDTATGDAATPAMNVPITLTRESGVTGTQRVNFALPLPVGFAANPVLGVRIGGGVVATGSRVLARHRDGSARSVQIQFDAPGTATSAEVLLGTTAPTLALVSVQSLLASTAFASTSSNVELPRVWVTLSADWLTQSEVGGHLLPHAQLTTAPTNAWRRLCDYGQWGSTAFAAGIGTQGSWLYDRGTALYRGYVQTGALAELRAAYAETDLYRQRMLGSSSAPIPTSDIKYNYTQNLALHFLLSGDDRFREAAETIAGRTPVSPFTGAYAFGNAQWTERNAGFALLANVYAARVTDGSATALRAKAKTIVDNLIAIQDHALTLTGAPANKQLDATYRCFAHTPAAHDPAEYQNLDGTAGTLVCSPWMSAITADALEAYADDEADGTERTRATNVIVRLGRRLGNGDDRGTNGRPHYLLGIDGANEPDGYNEHWGEVAQVVAMAYYYSGRTDATLRANAMHYVNGFDTYGVVGQVRSFNWQCRSAVATPFYLQ